MAYENFKPTVWSKHIQHELTKMMVMEDVCNTQFQGEIGLGKRVKIIGAARPTVKTYTPGVDIAAAETPADTSIFMDIDQYKYTHFIVDDIDEAQAVEGLMQAYMRGSAEELAEVRDTYIAQVAAKGAGFASASTKIDTADKAKAAIDTAFVKLWNNGVRLNADVTIIMSPWFYNLFKDKLTQLLTNNVDTIRTGEVGKYNKATVKLTNNVYNDGTDDYILICTKDAVSFASGISKVEPYRPEKQFSDAVKVLDTYGAKVVRPKEIYAIKAHNA